MGKRELLIVVGFFVVGAVVFRLVAPPAPESSSSFSLSNLFDEARREMRGNPGRATVTHAETLPAPAGLRELRVMRVGRALEIIGEDRDTIEFSLNVSSTGPDDAAANTYAERTRFVPDDLGDTLVLRVDYPPEASQDTSAVIRVPRRLAVRAESSNGVVITNVSAAHVEAARGTVSISDVAGPVTGIHQDGDVTVSGVASVKMRLVRLRSRFEGVSGPVTLDVRDGDCTVADSRAPVEIDSARGDITVTGPRGTVTVRGTDGRVTIEHPRGETRVDMRRTEVEVAIDAGVPVTVMTTDQTARLIVDRAAGFQLDALSAGGDIQAADLELTPEKTGNDSKLLHTFGGGGARVTIRNTRGDIVIRK